MATTNKNNNNTAEFKTVTNIYTGELTDSYIVNAKEIEIIKKLVTKDDICLDIGANVGFMTIQLAQLAKHVYAFEPHPDNYKQLEENTKDLDNVTRYKVAVSNQNGSVKLYTCPRDNGMNRLYDSQWCKGGEIKKVTAVTIDEIVFCKSPMEYMLVCIGPSFIKMDVEGYEYYALLGMRKVLERYKPTILMEFHPPSIEEAEGNPEHLHYLLRYKFGYSDPINCNTDETITSYSELDKQTRDQPAVNILWKYNSN